MNHELRLPIDEVRQDLDTALSEGPVVVCSPTGSGKSTQIPRWCAERGPVLVVEPRRVACRSLAQRVAELDGSRLGERVGYRVRDDTRASAKTEILYATTGVVVRLAAEDGLRRFATVVLDEFHERSLDVDLLLALFVARLEASLVVMSATLDGEAVAAHVGGRLIESEGRLHPVDRRYLPGEAMLPDVRGHETRLAAALDRARTDPGDVLVFLPGKGEIAAAATSLGGRSDFDVLTLHGGLSLEEQSRAFAPAAAGRRKVVLSTNVAETSVTIPGVGVVIDSGLVRRTRYHQGRSFLSLVAVAMDSAEQRAGRAGRTAPGVCYRLWSDAARLEASTPPEVHREALAPLVLSAAACGADPAALPFLDPPKDYALEAAREELQGLDAIDAAGSITERGRRLFGLPVDAPLGRLLVEAEASGCLADAVDLVAVLSVGRPLFTAPRRPEDAEEDDPRAAGCDAVARIKLLRGARCRPGAVSRYALGEARRISARLRGAFGLPRRTEATLPIDRRLLARTAISADPRVAHVARERRGRVSWSNGGTELELGRESAVDLHGDAKVEAIAVLESRGVGAKRRGIRLVATCAMPLRLSWLVDAGLGTERVRSPSVQKGVVVARLERVFARRVLDVREEVPRGSLARAAMAELFLEGRIHRDALAVTTERIGVWALLERLLARGDASVPAAVVAESLAPASVVGAPVPELAEWVELRLETLGVESGEDLSLLTEGDLLAPDIPPAARSWLDRAYPRRLVLGDRRYRVSYDLAKGQVTLEALGGGKRRPPPPLSYLPPFAGFRIVVVDRGVTKVLRD